jgi:hypothetical protein
LSLVNQANETMHPIIVTMENLMRGALKTAKDWRAKCRDAFNKREQCKSKVDGLGTKSKFESMSNQTNQVCWAHFPFR